MISTKPISTLAFGTMETGFTWADTVSEEYTVYIVAESRTLAVPAVPEYTIAIPAESRTIKIPADHDTLTVGAPT